MIADSDTVILVSTIGAAVIGAIVTLITTMMNIASANRRQRREMQYRGRQPTVIGLPFIVTVVLIVAVIYLATRPNDDAEVASEAPAPTPATTVVAAEPDTTPAPSAASTSTAASVTTAPPSPACAPFTVQIAAPERSTLPNANFDAQAQLLPFADGDAARDACFAIGQVLHDNSATFTEFQNKAGEIDYPYYRITQGRQVRGIDGQGLVCSPGAV